MIYITKKTKRVWIQAAIFLFIISISLYITYMITAKQLPTIDKWSSLKVEQIGENSTLYLSFRWITEMGSFTFLGPFVLLSSILFIWKWKDPTAAIFLILGTLSGYGLNILIKSIVERDRPRILAAIDAEGYSFPSGHAMVSLISYGLIAFFLLRYIKSNSATWIVIVLSTIFISLISFSRVIIRAHYVTDVVVGVMLGYVWLVIVIFCHQWWIQKRNKAASQTRV
jgi:membrane-associated phospholipid phosphatase